MMRLSMEMKFYVFCNLYLTFFCNFVLYHKVVQTQLCRDYYPSSCAAGVSEFSLYTLKGVITNLNARLTVC